MTEWVLILGGSTGHGAATAKRLAKDGYGVIAFHFDRGEAKKIAEETITEVNKTTGGNCHYFNTNAASVETMDKYIPQIKEITVWEIHFYIGRKNYLQLIYWERDLG